MRIAAGETIALLFELARDMDAVSSNHVSFNIQDLIIPVIHCSQLSGLNCCCLMPFNWSLNAAFLYVCLQEFEFHDWDELCDKLNALATDCNKHRAKTDKRKQRSVFRDVLKAVEVGVHHRLTAPHSARF